MAKIKLAAVSTKAPKGLNKEKTRARMGKILEELDELQNRLIAESKHALLIIIQGMDASGKDGTIRKVFSTMNPMGVSVKSFKVPTAEELAQDFLWRVHAAAPPKGMIRIFNRSQYEDVLVTRVHGWCDDETALKRMQAINDFERLLTEHNNTHILKFYLHISKEEQHKRLTERTHDPRKMWKYNERDFEESKLWNRYMEYYEACFAQCNVVPWHIVPSDQNWYKEYVIAKVVYDTLKSLKMQYPGLKK
ncbi:MAG TPA: polyphosphate kinase [Lacibacter sp.]|nr:polyphosphate kinase [Lacibacter sp.]HMO88017.1 polyphosphate kinase [Lacibacter sp.]HMP86443.1 polyphosphate kinase [Lacibacter sp.]